MIIPGTIIRSDKNYPLLNDPYKTMAKMENKNSLLTSII